MKIELVFGYLVASVAIFGVGFFWGLSQGCGPNPIESMPAAELRSEIDVYRECMQSAGKTGCRMQVPDFRRYHALRHELESITE